MEQVHPLFEYAGASDSTRETDRPLTEVQGDWWLAQLFDLMNFRWITHPMLSFHLGAPPPQVKLLLVQSVIDYWFMINKIFDCCKIENQERARVYVSDVPTDDWPTGVDQPRRNHAPRREETVERIKAVTISCGSSEDGITLAEHRGRMASGKRPTTEGPSQAKKKVTGPLRTGGALVINDTIESRKRSRDAAGTSDNEEKEDEQPLVRHQRTPTSPRGRTPPLLDTSTRDRSLEQVAS